MRKKERGRERGRQREKREAERLRLCSFRRDFGPQPAGTQHKRPGDLPLPFLTRSFSQSSCSPSHPPPILSSLSQDYLDSLLLSVRCVGGCPPPPKWPRTRWCEKEPSLSLLLRHGRKVRHVCQLLDQHATRLASNRSSAQVEASTDLDRSVQ